MHRQVRSQKLGLGDGLRPEHWKAGNRCLRLRSGVGILGRGQQILYRPGGPEQSPGRKRFFGREKALKTLVLLDKLHISWALAKCTCTPLLLRLWPPPSCNPDRAYLYSMGKKAALRLLPMSSSNVARFLTFFTVTFCGKFAITSLLHDPPHIDCVATLPCKI